MSARLLSHKTLWECPYWSVAVRRYRIEAQEKEFDHYSVDTRGSVYVIPVYDDGHIIAIEQYRYLIDALSLEFPGGGIPQEMSPHDAAHKELEEECGYIARTMTLVGKIAPMNGVSNEICFVYIARDLSQTQSHPESTELIRTIRIPPHELERRFKNPNVIHDGMTLAAWHLAQPHLS